MKQKMTLQEKMVYMITGKYPEIRDEEDIESTEKNSKEKKEEKKQYMKSVEKKFLEKTHMTKMQALEKVKKWEEKGENKKAQQGKKLLQEYFPSEDLCDDNAMDDKKSKKTTNPLKFLKKTSENPLSAIGISQKNPDTQNLPDENSIDNSQRTFAALSYVPFMSFFVVFSRKDSAFVQFHAWQGVTIIAVFLASFPLYWIISFIPGVGILYWLFTVFLLIGSIFASITAWSGRYISLPIISTIAKSLSGRE